LRDARLYFVADRGGMERALEGALAGGVDLFQLRDKDATDDELLAAAATARSLCEAAGALFLLNDRPDLAAASGADGVHVGQDDVPVDRARKLVGGDALVGLSTHSMQQAQAGCRTGADYIAVGPVHATPTKEGRPAIGVEPVPRGPYTGALGYVGWEGEMELAIIIRTGELRADALTLSVGGGIVADSTPDAEMAETEAKARAFTALCGGAGV
jgi:thiamine-phosphate pyrophosphorylase